MTMIITPAGIEWRGDGETVRIDAWGAGVRVRASQEQFPDADGALIPEARSTAAVDRIDGRTVRMQVAGTVVIAQEEEHPNWGAGYLTSSLRLRFENSDGRVLLEELGGGGALKLIARDYAPHAGGRSAITASFISSRTERLVGMGMYQQDTLDLKGATLELAHRNSQSSVPFVISSDGYGFLWNNPAIGRVVFGTNRTEWHAGITDGIDYWVVAGDGPAAIADAYAEVTGRAPMMPEYGLGFWQCKLRYWNQEQLLGVAREYRGREIPIDVIVADFFHWPAMGDWCFEEEFWPDPSAMVSELAEMGIELMVSVWPQVSTESRNFGRLRDENLLVKTLRGIDVQFFFDGDYARFIDVTNPRARDFLRERLKENYGAHGIRLFWLDEAEPEFAIYDFDHYRYHAGPGGAVTNQYPRDFVRAIGGEAVERGERPEVSLVRAAWAGSQRYGALVWSGDVHSTFQDLQAQITAGIQMGAAGIPWFTTDIGGFGGGDGEDPQFRELLARWFQFGTFSPVMRLHGDRRPGAPVSTASGEHRLNTGSDNEVWSFGPELENLMIEYIRLREDLRPYTRAAMEQAHTSGVPVMRGLFFEFPDDDTAWIVSDQYLFGADILVAPVVESGARSRRLYLPGAGTWTEVRTGKRFTGGQWVEVDAPITSVPVFARTDEATELLKRLSAVG
ncbi:TIM-barrel domain-containing protein [Arthrobacter sp. CJ23]|uniref:glycoside hydrolase family 31 protein n=1 Tax=Arthrobacter sp. CJ23 TaxID=2972479 RepID=UPI00215C97D1|nr:TIM-barrel domain-containing protein [Arthrobacter sp. CJ23]UVJ41304.1 family 31 glucosidase [Arthrobacter sp. CJ23]